MLISVCSRSEKRPKTLEALSSYFYGYEDNKLFVYYDAESIYQGHFNNLNHYLKNRGNPDWKNNTTSDDEVVVMAHDDVEILSDMRSLERIADIAKLETTGFIGVAGATLLRRNESWWSSRQFNATRGFVFQGNDPLSMVPNYFGPHGQVVVLDGCFLMASVRTLKKVGLEKPGYLSSDWDYYDLHLTYTAHREGLNNYTAPIVIRHDSAGEMRKGWYIAKDQFNNKFYQELPCKLAFEKTNGLPN